MDFQKLCDELIARWKSNQIALSELKFIETSPIIFPDGTKTYYNWHECPNDNSHIASMSLNYDWGMSISASPFLFCSVCDKIWYVNYDVANIIRKEEESYLKTLKSWDKSVPRMAKNKKVTGALLSKIHHSLGCDPETAVFILGKEWTEELQADYEKEYTKHRKTGKNLSSQKSNI